MQPQDLGAKGAGKHTGASARIAAGSIRHAKLAWLVQSGKPWQVGARGGQRSRAGKHFASKKMKSHPEKRLDKQRHCREGEGSEPVKRGKSQESAV